MAEISPQDVSWLFSMFERMVKAQERQSLAIQKMSEDLGRIAVSSEQIDVHLAAIRHRGTPRL